MKNIFAFLYLIFLPFVFFSQNAEFRYFGIEDGLSSTEIYSVLQDKDGYIWFGTSRGASRYDGFEFKNFTASDGLPANSVIKMFSDRWGRLWFSTYDGSLSYFKNGKIFHFDKNDTLLVIDKQYYIYNMFFDKDSILWIMPSRGGIFKFYPEGKIEKQKFDFPFRGFYFCEKGNDLAFAHIRGEPTSDTLKVHKYGDGYVITGFVSDFRRNVLRLNQDDYLVSLGSEMIRVTNGKITFYKDFENDITGLFADKDSSVWVSVMFDGVYRYDDYNFAKPVVKYLDEKSPIKVFQDNEGGYWFSTIESGLYYTPSFQFTTYQFKYNIQAIEIAEQKLYLSTFDKHLFQCGLKGDKILSVNLLALNPEENFTVMDIFATRDSSILFLGKEFYKLNDGEISFIDKFSGGFRIAQIGNNQFLTTSKGGFREYRNDTLFEEIKIEEFLVSNAIYQDKNKNIWLGGVTGLYSYKNKKITYWGKTDSLLKSRINDIKPYGKYLLIATNGSGLFVFNPRTKKIVPFGKNKGINSDFVNVIFVDDQDIWIGTNKGLCKMTLDITDEGVKFYTEKYTKADGLYSEEIKDIKKYGNYFFLATSRGLISFNPRKIKKNTIPPRLHILKFIINGQDFDFESLPVLKPVQNNITVHYKAISFRSDGNILYKYRLLGMDDNWSVTSDMTVRFPNLPPGEYTFEIMSSVGGDSWNREPIRISFKIRKPFQKTVFFPILLIILVAGIIYLAMSIYYRNIRKQLEHRKRLIMAEQKALRSQMNPHFIFNALNSIRRFILENDIENADYYLTSFAVLMRKVLDNSKHDLIPLDEEIETLKLYLELEKMRFDNSFEFKIEISPDIDTFEIMLPPMIIQPLLENAIWHGLAPKKKDGKLFLKFEQSNDYINIIVEDNGIGRDKAAEIAAKRKSHKSTGITNIKNRIRYFSVLTGSNMTLNFEDLYDEKGNPKGTKVTLSLNYKALTKL